MFIQVSSCFTSAMHQTITRREFLSRAGLTAAGVISATSIAPFASAIEPLKRSGKPKLMPSLAAYSFRQFFKDGKETDTKVEASRRIDMLQFVDYCAEHGCAAETTSYYFPAKVSDEFLLKLKRHAFLRGVEISGTAVGNTFTHQPGAKRDAEIKSVKDWSDYAAVFGAPHIRVFAGNVQGTTKEEAKKLCIEALEECCEHAGKKGVVLGLENHGGIVAEPANLLEIVRAVKSPWCGINLDTGNFHTDDPYRDLELIAPYAVNVQWKAEVSPRDSKQKQAADLKRIVKILRDANYQGYMALEYEAEEDAW
ncbi:MAG TPA: sugar phosphate isomerase/epimerase family protein, partial [Methylomirabilota bacterium]|nr:sugar phosphate isomerase/epimerase family protein [Methylomirabilota bacterium]